MLFLNRVLARGRSATPTELEFGHGLQASYRHFGVGDAVFTLKPQQRASVVHVVVRDEAGEVVGGARVHRASPGRPLPALRALGQAPALRAALVRGAQAGLVELGALWVERDEELRGLGRLIGQASVAAAAIGGAQRAVTFSHLTIAGMLGAIGMRPTPDASPIGYPNARYQSTVWEVDPRNPEHAHPDDRDQIEAIRDRWTDDPAASIAIEPTTGASLSWSVVDLFQPLTRPSERTLMSTQIVPSSSESHSPSHAASPSVAPTAADPTLSIAALEQGVSRGGATSNRMTRAAVLTNLYGLSDPTARLTSLYDELRQARVAGRTEVLARVMPGDGTLAQTLDLRPVPGGSDLVAQRLDVAIARTAAAIEASALPNLDPEYLVEEVGAHLEGFFARIHAGRWFRAVYDQTITRGQYVYTLSNMHQFVRFTTRILGRCVANAEDSALRAHFARHLSEEVNHELIIERDLTAMGEDVDFVRERMAPNLPTRQFMAAQESAIAFHRDPVLLLAAPLAAEGISGHLDAAFLDALHEVARGWGVPDPTRITRFYSSHMDYDGGDDGHWQSTVAVLSRYLTDETKLARFLSVLAATTHAMERCYDSWIEDIQLS